MKTSLILLLPITLLAACQSAPPQAPSLRIVVEGFGGATTRTTGAGICSSAMSGPNVEVSISGGGRGNEITGKAFCGTALEAAASATDPGSSVIGVGKATGTRTASGPAGCGAIYVTAAAPLSSWQVVCEFK